MDKDHRYRVVQVPVKDGYDVYHACSDCDLTVPYPTEEDIRAEYSHLPADVTESLVKYGKDLRDGTILIGKEFAEDYPGKNGGDQSLKAWVASHVTLW